MSYDGLVISYNTVGDMTSYDGKTYVWSDDSELTQIKDSATDTVLESYTYNAEGIRTSITVGSVTTTYTLQGALIDAETTNGVTVNYVYDSDNSPVYFEVSDGTTTDQYWYEKNAQGDILGIVDGNNDEVVTYTYDSWGKLLNTGGSLASTVGVQNHLLYRGYYYDSETGMYYLQSRYYDPELSRFISRDDISYHEGEMGAAANLYTYCCNDPVNNVDFNGHTTEAVRVAVNAMAGLYFVPGVGELVAVTILVGVAYFYFVAPMVAKFDLTYGNAYSNWYVKNYIKSKIETIARADARIRARVKKGSKTVYWSATLRLGYVDIGRPLQIW